MQHINNLTVPQFSQLTNKFGGKQSVNVILLKQDAEEDYIKLSENAVGKKSSLTPHTSISSGVWSKLVLLTTNGKLQEELLKLKSVETPSGYQSDIDNILVNPNLIWCCCRTRRPFNLKY